MRTGWIPYMSAKLTVPTHRWKGIATVPWKRVGNSSPIPFYKAVTPWILRRPIGILYQPIGALFISVICLLIMSVAGCRQPLSSAEKLRSFVEHQRKMDIILQDLQRDCDSSVERTLRYRMDSLGTALARPPVLPSARRPAASADFPRPSHHTHKQPHHHHHHSQP